MMPVFPAGDYIDHPFRKVRTLRNEDESLSIPHFHAAPDHFGGSVL